MVPLNKPTDDPCEGCGAAAGVPCNPHAGCQDMAREPQYGSAQLIHEVGWRPFGQVFRKPVTREAYLRDLAYAKDMAFPVHEWRGEDRAGEPMIIVWVTTGENGSLLSAYEIQGRA
jgi:hypothetical protein